FDEWQSHSFDLIIATSSPSFTHFKGSDFILKEIKTFLRTPDELFNLDDDYYDTDRNILFLEKLLIEDPSPNLPPMKNKDLNAWESLVHCMPKKGEMTVVENEDNELIPTRLVMGWRTRKTKRRPPSLALMGRLPIDACLSVYVMLWARSKGV
nr:reverse transcriptase domain-containing protein [Tanacetum cinerariifolium]